MKASFVFFRNFHSTQTVSVRGLIDQTCLALFCLVLFAWCTTALPRRPSQRSLARSSSSTANSSTLFPVRNAFPPLSPLLPNAPLPLLPFPGVRSFSFLNSFSSSSSCCAADNANAGKTFDTFNPSDESKVTSERTNEPALFFFARFFPSLVSCSLKRSNQNASRRLRRFRRRNRRMWNWPCRRHARPLTRDPGGTCQATTVEGSWRSWRT